MADELVQQIQTAANAAAARLALVKTAEELEAARIEFLGRNQGCLVQFAKALKTAAPEERPRIGAALNDYKKTVTERFERRKAEMSAQSAGAAIDYTIPGRTIQRGRLHPLRQTALELRDIFVRLGFAVADGPEIEDEFHNFDALNIPRDHPARESSDTFFLRGGQGGRRIALRSQTSTVQIRVMEKQKPPVRIIAPGKVFRPDKVDATHHFLFHQIEGLYVDEGVTMAHLKGIMGYIGRQMFGAGTQVRFRASYFPFTEPSAEFDFSCAFCAGKGCRICKNAGWIELGGCGMVDVNVFKAVGYDPERYTGWAFGFGIDRIAMMKYGINDIRHFLENDLRFLRQF